MNAALYPRVSSEDQQERGTIQNQIEFGTKYCDLHQIDIYDWYKDDGVSGTIPLEERPEGLRMLQDAKKGLFDTLLVYKLDRLGRSARVILNAVYELEQCGIKVKSMTEPFDTGDPAGRFLLTILAGAADLERSNILDRMWHGANRAARDGKWLGGIVPYGYFVNDDHYLEINDSPISGLDMSEAKVISLIYALTVEQHMSTIKIADYLNALGVPTSYSLSGRQIKKGKRKENTAGIWRPARIRSMIVNSTYKGIHKYGKHSKKQREIITREVPAIVSEDVWNKAQQVLKDNQIEATRSARRQYLLRSLIKCGCCGLHYTGAAYPNRDCYYVCNGKTSYRGPLQGKCKAKNVPQAWLEDLVWNDCINFIMNPGDALAELDTSMEETATKQVSFENEKDLILSTIREKESEKQSILDLYRRKLIDNKDVETQLQKISTERAVLESHLEALSGQLEAAATFTEKFSTAEQLLSDLREKLKGSPTFAVKREIVKTLVREITVETINPEGNPRDKRFSVSVVYSFARVVLHTDRDLMPPPA